MTRDNPPQSVSEEDCLRWGRRFPGRPNLTLTEHPAPFYLPNKTLEEGELDAVTRRGLAAH